MIVDRHLASAGWVWSCKDLPLIVVSIRYDIIVGKALIIILSMELARKIQSAYDKQFFAIVLFYAIL